MHNCNCISLLCASHAVTQRQIEGSKFLNHVSPFLMRALLPAMYGKCLQMCVSNICTRACSQCSASVQREFSIIPCNGPMQPVRIYHSAAHASSISLSTTA